MQTRSQLAFVLALALPSTGLLLGPTASSPPSGPPQEAQAPYTSGLSLEPGLYRLAAIEHAPFSAFQINEGSAGPTHSKAPPLSISRDSLGRTRVEYPTMGNAPADRVLPVPEIRDQVAGFVYLLDVEKKIAYRSTLAKAVFVEPTFDRNLCAEATGGRVLGCLPTGKHFLKPRCKSEKLGLQTIEGLQCQGMRATVSWPVGSQICNSHPVVHVTERWISASLRLAVIVKQSEKGGWETVQRLMNISRTEPDPNLFKVPPDYKIVDSTGPVIINYTYPLELSNVAPPVMITQPKSDKRYAKVGTKPQGLRFAGLILRTGSCSSIDEMGQEWAIRSRKATVVFLRETLLYGLMIFALLVLVRWVWHLAFADSLFEIWFVSTILFAPLVGRLATCSLVRYGDDRQFV